MAVAYHHIDEYEDVMPTPTNDVEIFRNTKFSQQWDKKIHETITQTETDHSKIINDKALTKEEKKPIVLQYPAFNMQGKHNKSSTENHKENEKKNVKTEEKGKNSNSNNNNVTMSNNNNNNKQEILIIKQKHSHSRHHFFTSTTTAVYGELVRQPACGLARRLKLASQ